MGRSEIPRHLYWRHAIFTDIILRYKPLVTERNVESEPLSSPWERGPDLIPVRYGPRGRGQHSYREL
jgi:hypothetical protein